MKSIFSFDGYSHPAKWDYGNLYSEKYMQSLPGDMILIYDPLDSRTSVVYTEDYAVHCFEQAAAALECPVLDNLFTGEVI